MLHSRVPSVRLDIGRKPDGNVWQRDDTRAANPTTKYAGKREISLDFFFRFFFIFAKQIGPRAMNW